MKWRRVENISRIWVDFIRFSRVSDNPLRVASNIVFEDWLKTTERLPEEERELWGKRKKYKLMNCIWWSRINDVRSKRGAKSKVRNVGGRLSGSFIVTNFPFEVKKPISVMLSTHKIESWIQIAVYSVSRLAITVLVSKYDATVETKFLIEMDD